jgi:plasmid stabilization system protein ParE
MKYTVILTPAAEQDLARVWMNASDRNAVTAASHLIDRLLANDPEKQGAPRFDTVRTMSIPPLGVDYEIVEDDRIVYVLTVWDTSQSASP